jgi:hypothetical protein
MRIILVFLMLLSSHSIAQEVNTESFTISLPDELKIETDRVRRILAFGKNRTPFITIEFGNGIREQYLDIASRANETLARMNAALSKKECGTDCEAMYAEGRIKNESLTVYSYVYLVKSKMQSFIITIVSQEPINSGELEVTNIGQQILQSGI